MTAPVMSWRLEELVVTFHGTGLLGALDTGPLRPAALKTAGVCGVPYVRDPDAAAAMSDGAARGGLGGGRRL